MNRLLYCAALLAAASALSGCSAIGVKPWERDLLAKPAMDPAGDTIDTMVDEHLYFSKEASTGGRGFGGGGCGCN